MPHYLGADVGPECSFAAASGYTRTLRFLPEISPMATKTRPAAVRTEASASRPAAGAAKSVSMHEDVPVWHDCCCCEAEPRWIEIAPELGIDLDADWDAAVARQHAERG